MVERALLADRKFGLVSSEGFGTIATIKAVQRLDDGRSMLTLRGGSRFRITGRQWSEACDGCPHPLNYAGG